MPVKKPSDARHLKNALAHTELSADVLRVLNDKAMDKKFTTTVPGHSCIVSTRTGSQDMPQLKLEADGKVTQILCTHAVALHRGDVPEHWYDELSHLCGIRQCLVHTKWELPWDNASRDGCHKYRHFSKCPHNPPCLPEPPYTEVLEAISKKRKTEEEKVLSDPRKVQKQQQNKLAYQRRKEAAAARGTQGV